MRCRNSNESPERSFDGVIYTRTRHRCSPFSVLAHSHQVRRYGFPPFTVSIAPVMFAACGPAKNAIASAMSSGVDSFPVGV
jgi:hypothetical protein